MKTNGELMHEKLEAAMAVGEGPYQANRTAVKELDIFGDKVAGAAKLRATVAGIDAFAAALEDFKDVAENVARRALSTVR